MIRTSLEFHGVFGIPPAVKWDQPPLPTDIRRATTTPVPPITRANEDRSRSIWTSSQCDAAAEFHQEALVLRGAEVLLSQADELVNVSIRLKRSPAWVVMIMSVLRCLTNVRWNIGPAETDG